MENPEPAPWGVEKAAAMAAAITSPLRRNIQLALTDAERNLLFRDLSALVLDAPTPTPTGSATS